jgi:hypothetical protein
MWTKWARPQAEWAQGPAGRPGFEVVRPEPWLPHVYMRRRSPSRWRMSVEATPPRLSATTWCQTNLSKTVEVPFTPINTQLTVKVETPLSTYSSPPVNVPV